MICFAFLVFGQCVVYRTHKPNTPKSKMPPPRPPSPNVYIDYDDATCQKKLAELSDKEMFGDHDGYALIKGIEKLLKRCPKSALIHWAYAENLQEKGAFFNVPDWQNTSFIHYAKAFELDTVDVEYRWSYANMLEYIGQYNKASAQYKWLVNNDTIYQKDAKAHMIACNFLYKNRGDKSDTLIIGNTKAQLSEIELSINVIKKRRNFEYLTKMTAATSIAGNITGSEGDGKQIQVALGFLSDWEKDPKKFSIAEQNDLLVAILVTLSSITIEKGLNTKVGNFDFLQIKSELSGYANNSIPKEYGDNFKKLKPQDGRTFEIGNDLTITEKWASGQLTGEYMCIQTNSPGGCQFGIKKGTINTFGCRIETVFEFLPTKITQQGNQIEIYSEHNGTSTAQGCKGGTGVTKFHSETHGKGILSNNKSVIYFTYTSTSTGLNATPESKVTSEHNFEVLNNGNIKFSDKNGYSILNKIK